MQPSEIENMPFYEVEYTIENLTNDLQKKQEAEQQQHEGHDAGSYMKQGTKMMNNAKSGNAKSINTPKMPNMKMPSVKI